MYVHETAPLSGYMRESILQVTRRRGGRRNSDKDGSDNHKNDNNEKDREYRGDKDSECAREYDWD